MDRKKHRLSDYGESIKGETDGFVVFMEYLKGQFRNVITNLADKSNACITGENLITNAVRAVVLILSSYRMGFGASPEMKQATDWFRHNGYTCER